MFGKFWLVIAYKLVENDGNVMPLTTEYLRSVYCAIYANLVAQNAINLCSFNQIMINYNSPDNTNNINHS